MTDTKTCKVAGCTKAARARGMCTTHYRRWRREGDLEAPVQERNADDPMSNYTVRLPDSLRAAVEAMAAKAGRDMGAEVRAALEAWTAPAKRRAKP